MNTQLTQEDKARIFAMYLGSELTHTYPDKDYQEHDKILTISKLSQISDPKTQDRKYWSSLQYYKLHLYDLSDITDEDAVEVASMNYPDAYDSNTNADLAELGRKISKRVLDQTLCCENAVDTIDYLRSKSYHLPYKGVNLFDAGIAIRKTKTITQ